MLHDRYAPLFTIQVYDVFVCIMVCHVIYLKRIALKITGQEVNVKNYKLFRTVSPCIAILLYIVGSFASSGTVAAHTSGVPGGNVANPVVRAVDLAKPAVVRIVTTVGARLTVQFPDNSSADFPLNGKHYQVQVTGSGAFVTSHGDVLTADHVIKPPTKDHTLDPGVYTLAAQDIADYINHHFPVIIPYTKDDVLNSLLYGVFLSQAHYDAPKSEVFVSTDYFGTTSATNWLKMPAFSHAQVDRVESDSPVDQRDLALVHVNMEDTPVIRLGDSSNVEPQDELTILGFPGNGDIDDADHSDPNNYFTLSVNKLYVSAIKKGHDGASIIQVGGNVEHGDSGGPALDSNGNVVGVVSFSSQNADLPLGTSFLQDSDNAKQWLESLKLDTTPGPLQKAWEHAFADYASKTPGHWHKAQRDFEQLLAKYPNFGGATPYLSYATTQASHEPLPKPKPRPQPAPNYTWEIIAGITIILFFAVGIGLIFWRRRKNAASLAVQAAQVPATGVISPDDSLLTAVPLTPAYERYEPEPPVDTEPTHAEPAVIEPPAAGLPSSASDWTLPETPSADASPNGAEAKSEVTPLDVSGDVINVEHAATIVNPPDVVVVHAEVEQEETQPKVPVVEPSEAGTFRVTISPPTASPSAPLPSTDAIVVPPQLEEDKA
jgi:S1-C subfamily serine protease